MEQDMLDGLEEQKEELDLAKDYRRLTAKEFFEKYQMQILDLGPSIDWKFIEKIDNGLETLLFLG